MRMTLDETWKNCLRHWRWVAKKKRNGSRKNSIDLKYEWCELHDDIVDSGCFFCDYSITAKRGRDFETCHFCPAKKIDPIFDCNHGEYSYVKEPIAFYNKLVSLNHKRLKVKK